MEYQVVRPALLVFPINLDACAAVVETAQALGFRVTGASSDPTPSDLFGIDDFAFLPYVTHPDFEASLWQLVETQGATHLASAHQGVWAHLDMLLARRRAQGLPAPSLCGPYPHAVVRRELLRSQRWARRMRDDALADNVVAVAGQAVRPALGEHALAGLHRQFVRTPGQCDETKLGLLCAIARLAPVGDVVEIGVLYGRSALGLCWLATHYAIGATVCVDPWGFALAQDQGEGTMLLNGSGIEIDFEHIFQNFLAAAVLMPGIGYIRQPSHEAVRTYRQAAAAGALHAPGLVPVSLKGRIAVLHIDGNHAYEAVWSDYQAWSPHLVEGGWLLIDDYLWAFGDGPRRLGDALAASGDFDAAFVCGDTLCLRRSRSLP